MKWSFAAIGLTILGLIGLSIVFLFEEITTNNESDYYLLKEITEAAMIDSIDLQVYRYTGELEIVEEKFVENFTRRYAESTLLAGTGYTINFYSIIENPPKASIIISTGVTDYAINEDFSHGNDYIIKNYLDGILEFTNSKTFNSKGNPYETKLLTKKYYYISEGSGNASFGSYIPKELKAPNIKNVKVDSITNVKGVENQGDVANAILHKKTVFDQNDSGVKFFNYDDCRDSSGSLSGNSVTASGPNKCAAIKFDVTWSYEEY